MKRFAIALMALPLFLIACSKSDTAATTGGTTPAPATAGAASAGAATAGSETGAQTGGAASAESAKDQVVGSWKVDQSRTTIPGATEKDKKEMESFRLEFKADGTFTVSGVSSGPTDGKWEADGKNIKLSSEKQSGTPPLFKLSDDGTSLSVSQTQGDKTMTLTLVKG